MSMDARARIVIEAVARQMVAEMQRAGKAIQDLDKKAQEAAKRQQLIERTTTRAGLALTGFAAAGGVALYSATRLAARVETLGVVTRKLGDNAGFSADQIDAFEQSVKAQGITLRSTRESMSLMMQSQVDLTHATDLARMAQDAAVIANVNSSEAFRRLVFVITSGNVRMARTLGLQVSFQDAYKKTAEELGKTTEELTQLEKVGARTNEVLRAGTTIVGTYEAAMTTAGKKVLSLDRHIEETRRIIGELFLPVMAEAVDSVTEFLESFEEASEAQQRGTAATIATTVALSGYVGVLLLARGAAIKLAAAIKLVGSATVVATGGIIAVVAALASLVVISQKVKAENVVLTDKIRDLNKRLKEGEIGVAQWRGELLAAAEGTQLWTNAARLSEKTGRDFNEVFFELAEGTLIYTDAAVIATEKQQGLLVGTQEWIEFIESQATPALEDQTNALLATEQAMSDLDVLISSRLTSDYEDMIEKQGELEEKAADLRGEISELEGSWKANTKAGKEELGELRDELAETEGKIDKLGDAWDEQTKRFILNMLQQRAALLPDELASDAFKLISGIAEDWGLVDEGARLAMEGADVAFGLLESGAGLTAAQSAVDLLQLNLEETGGVAMTASDAAGLALQVFSGSPGAAAALSKLQEIKGWADSIAGTYAIRFKISSSGNGHSGTVSTSMEESFKDPHGQEETPGGTGRQFGGKLGPGINIVGEAGPEAVIGDTVFPADLTRKMAGIGAMPPAQGGGFQAVQIAQLGSEMQAMREILEPLADDIARGVRDALEGSSI